MTQLIKTLLILLSAFVSLIQAQAQGKPKPSPSPKPLPFCNRNEIHTMNLAGCRCQGHRTGCAPDCHTCGFKIDKRHTKSCDPGCTDNDANCEGCGLLFSTLCDCLKGPSGCIHTGTVKPNGGPIWVLTPKGEPLVTTTDLLPGILEMAKDPSRYEEGWDFAQEHYNPREQALALNSVRSRTHEQFHIHICKKPGKTDRALAILETAKHNPTKHLIEVGKDLYCMTVEKGNGPVKGFVAAIQEFLKKGTVCDGLAGAGIIRDSHENLWACVSGNSAGPLAEFCA